MQKSWAKSIEIDQPAYKSDYLSVSLFYDISSIMSLNFSYCSATFLLVENCLFFWSHWTFLLFSHLFISRNNCLFFSKTVADVLQRKRLFLCLNDSVLNPWTQTVPICTLFLSALFYILKYTRTHSNLNCLRFSQFSIFWFLN
jgi:hypothetical protein